MKETEQLKNLMESMDGITEIGEEEPRAAEPGIPGVARKVVKGEGTRALRQVFGDFGTAPTQVYSDQRQDYRRVKAFIGNQLPTQEELEASVAKHFKGLEVIKVVAHKADRNRSHGGSYHFYDKNYIAVAYR